MNIQSVNITANTRALIATATVEAKKGRVVWGRDDYVEFKREGTRLVLTRVRANGNWESIWSSTTWNSFSTGQQELIIAATLCTGNNVISFGSVVLQINAIVAPTPVVEPVHATSWKTAQGFALSGHRVEVNAEIPSPTFNIKLKGNKANALGVCLAVVGLGLAILAGRT